MINARKLFSLENLIYATVLCLPLYLVRFQVFGVPTNILEILILIVFIWWSSKNQKSKIKNQNDPVKMLCINGASNAKFKIVFTIFFLIFIGFLASTFLNGNVRIGLGIIKGWLVLPFLFFIVTYSYLSKEKIYNVFLAIYASSFVVAVIALVYWFLGIVTYDERLQAFFNSPNYLAMYLAPGIIAGIQLLQERRSWRNFMSLIIIITALYFTYSYASWIAIFLSIATMFLWNKKLKFKHIIGGVIILLSLFFFHFDSPKFNNAINFSERSSLSSRVMIWQSAGKILADNWLLGIGPGSFQEKYLEYQKYFTPYLEWAVPHPHNVFLAFWLSGGIIGFMGFLGLIIFFFREMFRKINAETPRRGVSTKVIYISLGIMLYILIHGLVDTTILKNDLAIIFWFCFLILKD